MTFSISEARFRIAMDKLRAFMKIGAREIVVQQFRPLMEQIAKFTPPQNQAQGRRRVESDILKVMRRGDKSEVKDERLKKIIRSGDHEAFRAYAKACGKENDWRSTPFDPQLHKNARDNRGRVRRSRKRAAWVIGRSDMASLSCYVRKKQFNVGLARSGWAAAMRSVNLEVPPWVIRHTIRYGAVIDNRNADKPSMTAINRTLWAGRREEGERIIRDAMRSRVSALETLVRVQVKLAGQQAGLKVP